MKSIVKFLGRVALVIILFSSAFIHLQQPEKFVTFYEIAYPEAKQLADGYGITFLPPVERVEPHYRVIARLAGLFEALIGLLILFGSSLGGALYVIKLAIGVMGAFGSQILNIMDWSKAQHIQLSNITLFIGIGIVLYAYQREKQDDDEPQEKTK